MTKMATVPPLACEHKELVLVLVITAVAPKFPRPPCLGRGLPKKSMKRKSGYIQGVQIRSTRKSQQEEQQYWILPLWTIASFLCSAIAAMHAQMLHPRVTHHPANGTTRIANASMSTTRTSDKACIKIS